MFRWDNTTNAGLTWMKGEKSNNPHLDSRNIFRLMDEIIFFNCETFFFLIGKSRVYIQVCFGGAEIELFNKDRLFFLLWNNASKHNEAGNGWQENDNNALSERRERWLIFVKVPLYEIKKKMRGGGSSSSNNSSWGRLLCHRSWPSHL